MLVRDLPTLIALGASGATTVAATAHLAALAGVRVFATGGLGGVHRDAKNSFDESADLTTLARTPITVVAAGVKSILDIPATLERLETLSVPVLGYRTKKFPSFWLTDSGFELDWSVDSPEQIASVMRAQDALGHGQASSLPTHCPNTFSGFRPNTTGSSRQPLSPRRKPGSVARLSAPSS